MTIYPFKPGLISYCWEGRKLLDEVVATTAVVIVGVAVAERNKSFAEEGKRERWCDHHMRWLGV
jgi:hypothetical protein